MTGQVVEINIAPRKHELPQPVEHVAAHAGKGLQGNRYYFEEGAEAGRAITLIETEAIAGMAAEYGIEITAAESRRNVLTQGIKLNELVGKRFRIGDVECLGVELCHPCTTLEGLTKPGVIKGLVNRGGLNADIVTDGVIAVGDEVTATG
jgi:MOSC domain-containing protein YiiM